ncbi:hypothetical protein D3C79_824540 [compost metagenome]
MVHRPAIYLLDIGRVGDFVADQVPFPGDDARAFLGQLHACFAFHDLGGVAAAQVGHRQLDHLMLLDVLQGLFAIAQPDPVDLEKVGQLAQVVVVDLAATGPLVHRGARNAQGRAHGLQGQLVMLEQFLEAEGEAVFQHRQGVLIWAKSLPVYPSCQLLVDGSVVLSRPCVACTGLIAGKPAPTSTASPSSHVQYLWELACRR